MLPVSRIGVSALIDELVDDGTFVEWTPDELGVEIDAVEQPDTYGAELASARLSTGRAESVVVGLGQVAGNDTVLILGDFDFLAGSVGRAACALVIAAFERAGDLALPVFASPSSGGTRMQEGTAAFVLMADVAACVQRFRETGNSLTVWLRNPTTGGVMATWGSLGTFTFGEPGALTGFLGPRVYQELTGEPFPQNVQTSENLAAHGVIDGVVPLTQLRKTVTNILDVVGTSADETAPNTRSNDARSIGTASTPDPWECVERTRLPARPTSADLLDANLSQQTQLSGTTKGERSEAVTISLGLWHGIPVVVAAQDRAAQARGAHLNPAALRTARRAMKLASELDVPFVSVVDTAGAELSASAEESALAGEIARCLADLTTLQVPTVSVLLGMGCGGGALAMLPADKVISLEFGWVSPLPLEGASIIRFRTPDRAAEMARSQEVAAWQLARRGIVDTVVSEAHDLPGQEVGVMARLGDVVADELAQLCATEQSLRLATRSARYHGGVRRGR